MAIEHYRVALGGNLPGGEVWSINPAFQGDFSAHTPTHAELQTWASNIAGDMSFIVGDTLRLFLSNDADVRTVRVNYYDATGRLADYATAALPAPFAGTGGLKLPPTAAVALSLYTATQTRRGRGRLFWPALGATLTTDAGRFSSAATSALATDAVAMLAELVHDAPADLHALPCVYSTMGGNTHPVTSVRVGDVPDSQRGRKNALSDVYAIAAYPA